MYLLDSNILIYLQNEKEKVWQHTLSLGEDAFAISVISRFEVRVGIGNDASFVERSYDFLSQFKAIPINAEIIDLASELYIAQGTGKSIFKDVLIAATAIIQDLTLVTADKDFKKFKKLKLHLLKI